MAAKTFEEVMKTSTTTTEEPTVQQEGDSFSIFKTDDDKRLVFGWASISITVDGEQLEDRQKDIIDPEDLEEAAYEYVLNFRDTGEEHISTMRKKGKLVESCVFTAEKQKAIGIPEGTLPIGWWIGFKIEDDAAWERVKNGTYRMFSIEGKANRIPVEKGLLKGCGVLVVQDGKILSGTRIERGGRGKICGPGGHIEPGETSEEAAKREAMEEFGITCENLIPLGTLKDGTSDIFLCTEFSGTPETDEEEMTEPKWRTIEELRQEELFRPFAQSLDILEKCRQDQMRFAKTFNEILKANPHHDELGRFTTASGGRTAPRVMSGADFDAYVEKNGLKTIYRGYSADTQEHLDKYEESIKTGTSASSGEKTSALGKGVYFANDHSEAEGYMNRRKQENGDKYGRVTTAALDVGAKTGDFNEYQRMKFEAESELNRKAVKELVSGGGVEAGQKLADQAMEIRQMSVPEYAATKGLDALYDDTTGYTVVMNQKALVVKADGVSKSAPVAKTFSDILKFNPFHDSLGRFATANGYASFTMQTKDPKKQHWADMAIARMKQQHAANPPAPPKPVAPPKPTKNFDSRGFADYDDADYHQLYNRKQYFQQQQLTPAQKKAADDYVNPNTEPGSLYNVAQNLNWAMVSGQTPTGKHKQVHDNMMDAMHNIGHNVTLTRYDHAGMVDSLLSSVGAGNDYTKLSMKQIQKALVGQTLGENKFISTTTNDFGKAPSSAQNLFKNRAVKINYKAKANVQGLLMPIGSGGDQGELVLAPTNGKANKAPKITAVRSTGKTVYRANTGRNYPQIEIDLEWD